MLGDSRLHCVAHAQESLSYIQGEKARAGATGWEVRGHRRSQEEDSAVKVEVVAMLGAELVGIYRITKHVNCWVTC